MTKTKIEKIASIEEEIRQLENQKKQLIQKQKEEERKARNHRLCSRGSYLEKIMPETITLTDEQFKAFLDKTLLTDFARKILEKITAQNGETGTQNPAVTAAHTNALPNAKPTETAQGGGTSGNENEGNGARQGG